MERRICKLLGFAGPFTAGEMPDLPARIYAVASIIAGEVDLPLLELLAQRGPVALDVQGFVRVRDGDELVFRPWAEMERGLSLVTYLKVDRAEAELLTGRPISRLRPPTGGLWPREIVLTQSTGVTVCGRRPDLPGAVHPPFPGRPDRPRRYLLCQLPGVATEGFPAEAVRVAGAVTTLKQEHPGPWKGTPADVELIMSSQKEF